MIAFFDLDKTLLSVNSGTLWVRREVALGHLTKRQALVAAGWLVKYSLGLSALDAMIAQAIASAAGTRERDVRGRTESFYRSTLRHLFRPGALSALEQHRQRGDQLVLLTSSSHYLSKLVAQELELDGFLCNELEIDSAGLHTGRTVGPLCFGEGKLTYARTECAARSVSLEACSFYTDSFADLPVLEAIGQPVCVNPDPRLSRHARRRKWKIVDWGMRRP